MTYPNRLIDDFKRQTKTTVWKHLNAMATNYAVYSTRLNGLSPYLTDYTVCLYCNETNLVIVCLDHCGSEAYEEVDPLSPMLLFEDCEPRVSVVWKLNEAVRLAKKSLQSVNPDMKVFGVLLTEAEILNSFALDGVWNASDIMVIDGLKRLKYKQIRTNSDYTLASKAYADAVIGRDYDATAEDEDEDEPSSDTDDFIFPDGEIQQNNNISVKVEILRPIPNPREELDKLVGCADIKRRMDEIVALTNYNKMMRKLFPNSKQHEVSLHSVFLGRPGTGKTTVCKIFGSLLHKAGALSKGHVVVCDRGTFIGTLWGDEERSMRQVLQLAKGGVLMIDEAYLLNGKHEGDPGKLVIQLLMNVLADETQRDIAVVLCGYREPMMKLLDSNPGLQSRFPNKFEFTDFTVDELLQITRSRVSDYDYKFTVEAWAKYSTMLAQAYQMRNPETWGNARFIANQLDRIYIRHATRCVSLQPKDKRELLLLTPEDIMPIEVPRQKAQIGFH